MDIHPFRMVAPMRGVLDRTMQHCIPSCPARLTRYHDALRTHGMYNGVSHAAILGAVSAILQQRYRDCPVSCVSRHFHKAQLDAVGGGGGGGATAALHSSSSCAALAHPSSPTAVYDAHPAARASGFDSCPATASSAAAGSDDVIVSTENLYLVPRFLRALHNYPVSCRAWQYHVESQMVAHVQRLAADEVSSEECVNLWAVVCSCLHWCHVEALLQHFPLVHTLPMLSREEFHTVLAHVCVLATVGRARQRSSPVSNSGSVSPPSSSSSSSSSGRASPPPTRRFAEMLLHHVMDLSLLWRRCAEDAVGEGACGAAAAAAAATGVDGAALPETTVCSCLMLAGLTREWGLSGRETRKGDRAGSDSDSPALAMTCADSASATKGAGLAFARSDSTGEDGVVCRRNTVAHTAIPAAAAAAAATTTRRSGRELAPNRSLGRSAMPSLSSLHAHNLSSMCDRLRVMMPGYDILPHWARQALRGAVVADVWRYTWDQGVEFTCAFWVWWFDRHEDALRHAVTGDKGSARQDEAEDHDKNTTTASAVNLVQSSSVLASTSSVPSMRAFLGECFARAVQENILGQSRSDQPALPVDVALKASVAASVLRCRDTRVCDVLLRTLVREMRQVLTRAVCAALHDESSGEVESHEGARRMDEDVPTGKAEQQQQQQQQQQQRHQQQQRLPSWQARSMTSVLWTRWQPTYTGYALAAAEYFLTTLSSEVENALSGMQMNMTQSGDHDRSCASNSNNDKGCAIDCSDGDARQAARVCLSSEYDALKQELLDMSRAVLTRRVWQRRGCARLVALLLLHAPRLTRELGLVHVCLSMLQQHLRSGFTRDQLSSILARYAGCADAEESLWPEVRQVMEDLPVRAAQQE